MMDKIKLLLVEGDTDFVFILGKTLKMSGDYNVCVASDGREGLELYKSFEPDIIVANTEMPIMDGLEMVRIIRRKDFYTPIIFATHCKEPEDHVEGIEAGAIVYLHKPVLPKVIDAQIRSLLRWTSQNLFSLEGNGEYVIGSFVFNMSGKCLIRKGKRTDLTRSEAKILDLLTRNKGRLVKREDMEAALRQGNEVMSARVLDSHICNLRKKIQKDRSVKIRTIRGTGHILEV